MEGLGLTLWISFLSVVLSIALGIPAGLLMSSKNKFLRGFFRLYLEFIRVMPILVLLFFFYYTLSRYSAINLSPFFVSVMVFTMWGVAEMADLVRAAVTSIPAHQRESGRALGLSELQINFLIILPQAIRRLLPGVINLTTRMIKTTPFVFFINMVDLFKVGQQIVEVSGMRDRMASVWVYGFIFILFFVICYPISLFSRYLENKYQSA
ncbi:MAG: amino acid ABC transporter permease [Deltaproteobacteria bacterium]|jgi:polar amino acid transport system permease protein|nr:amino acid ABC transporter permease [Deltaproteobacteria bacterium]